MQPVLGFQIIVDNMCNIFLEIYLISLESHRTDVNKNVVADKQKPQYVAGGVGVLARVRTPCITAYLMHQQSESDLMAGTSTESHMKATGILVRKNS